MMVEWDVPFFLVPSDGSLEPLPFNAQVYDGSDPLGFFALDSRACSAGAARRITRANIAQADGELTSRKFKSGYVAELNCQLWETIGSEGQPACGGVARRMADILDEYVEAIANSDGQLYWQPSPYPVGSGEPNERMLDRVRSMGPSGDGAGGSGFVSIVVNKDSDTPLIVVTFALLSPLPYAMDKPLTTTDISLGATVTNEGNAAYFPVLRISNNTTRGPNPDTWETVTGFTITNESVTDETGEALSVVYDSTLPGAGVLNPGDQIEIDLFLNTVYMSGIDPLTDFKAGIDVKNSDFWPLAPGDNDIVIGAITGTAPAEFEILWRAGWV